MRGSCTTRVAVIVSVLMLTAGCGRNPATGPSDELPSAAPGDPKTTGADVPFSALAMFLEFNATDNDLGVQVFLDAEDWRWIKAFDGNGGKVLDIAGRSQLRSLGITELRFESAEPSPGEVLALFPAGVYRFEGMTTEGDRLVGTASLSQDLPPAPAMTPEDGDVTDAAATVIAWNPIPGLAGYEVIVADEGTGASLEVRLGPSAVSFHVPAEFLRPGSEYKAEVLSIAVNGNKTISEATFTTMP